MSIVTSRPGTPARSLVTSGRTASPCATRVTPASHSENASATVLFIAYLQLRGSDRIRRCVVTEESLGSAARDPLPGARHHLPRVGFFQPQHVRDLAVGILERLAKDERGPLGRFERLEQPRAT